MSKNTQPQRAPVPASKNVLRWSFRWKSIDAEKLIRNDTRPETALAEPVAPAATMTSKLVSCRNCAGACYSLQIQTRTSDERCARFFTLRRFAFLWIAKLIEGEPETAGVAEKPDGKRENESGRCPEQLMVCCHAVE